MKPSPNRIRKNASPTATLKQAPALPSVVTDTAPETVPKTVQLTENDLMDIEMAVDKACSLLNLLGEEAALQKQVSDKIDGESLGHGTMCLVWDAQFALRDIVETVKGKATA